MSKILSAEEIYFDLKEKNQRTGATQDTISIAAMKEYAAQFQHSAQAVWGSGDEELFKDLWYSRNPVHELNANSGKDMFWGTAELVAREYVAKLTIKLLGESPTHIPEKISEEELQEYIKQESEKQPSSKYKLVEQSKPIQQPTAEEVNERIDKI